MPIVARRLLPADHPGKYPRASKPASAAAVDHRYDHVVPRSRTRSTSTSQLPDPVQEQDTPCPVPNKADEDEAIGSIGSKKAASDTKRPYEVGYCKTPKHTRFQPGISGNKKGRPKGAKGLKTIVREVLGEKVSVRMGGKLTKMPKVEAMLRRGVDEALAGSARQREYLLRLYGSSVADDLAREGASLSSINSSPVAITDLDAHDQAIIAALIAEQMSKQEPGHDRGA